MRSRDLWCAKCEQAYATDDAIVVEESTVGEFWGSPCSHVTQIHHCPECREELDEYSEHDKAEEADDQNL